MRATLLIIGATALASCAHSPRPTAVPPDPAAIDARVREEIAFYQAADAAGFVADCRRMEKWKLLSCSVSVGHVTTFPGLTREEVARYVSTGRIAFESIDDWSVLEGIFGESLDLRSQLRDAREAYAVRVNRAVLTEIKKEAEANQFAEATPVEPAENRQP